MKKSLFKIILCTFCLFLLVGCNVINESVDNIKVPIAIADIEQGVILTEEMIQMQEMEENDIPENAITNINDVIGKTATTYITKGSIFTTNTLE